MISVLQYLVGPLLVALVTGLFIYAGRHVDAKASREAALATARIEERKVDLTVFTESIDALQERLERVEGDLQHEKDQRRLSNGYARTLANVLRSAGISVPQPPAGLDIDL